MTDSVQTNDVVQEPLINTPLQRGDGRYPGIATASAVFAPDGKTAEAVCTRVIADDHLAEARC